MAETATGNETLVFINVFTVEPKDQDHLLELLIEATDQVISKIPGFISASFHKSFDGTRVINYAQWKSRETFETLFANPEAVRHMTNMRGLATTDKNFYEVVSVHTPK